MALAVLATAILLASCTRPADAPVASEARGRYAGIGHYTPGRIWAELVRAEAPADARRARLADDDQVIVVVDSQTGEVRQCGNLSGHCIGMNAWGKPLGLGQTAPQTLARHAADLDAQPAPATKP